MELPRPPQRIVSLVPSLTETLWWYHAADSVVGCTDYCVAPPGAFRQAQRLRGTKNPDVAAIVALEPDVVLANEEENRRLDVERLRAAGVTVYVTAPRTVAAAADSLRGVGQLVGAPDAGERLAQAIRRARAQLPPVRAPLRAFVPVWRDPWMAVGHDTYASDLLACAGFVVVPEAPRYPRVALADVRAARPDVVLLPDEPYAFSRRDRAVFDGWEAAVRLLDGTALTWHGPRAPSALADLGRLRRSLATRRSRRLQPRA